MLLGGASPTSGFYYGALSAAVAHCRLPHSAPRTRAQLNLCSSCGLRQHTGPWRRSRRPLPDTWEAIAAHKIGLQVFSQPRRWRLLTGRRSRPLRRERGREQQCAHGWRRARKPSRRVHRRVRRFRATWLTPRCSRPCRPQGKAQQEQRFSPDLADRAVSRCRSVQVGRRRRVAEAKVLRSPTGLWTGRYRHFSRRPANARREVRLGIPQDRFKRRPSLGRQEPARRDDNANPKLNSDATRLGQAAGIARRRCVRVRQVARR